MWRPGLRPGLEAAGSRATASGGARSRCAPAVRPLGPSRPTEVRAVERDQIDF